MKFSNYDVCEGVRLRSRWESLSCLKHTIAQNPSAKKNFKKLDEALPVMERMILSNDECVHPVPPSDCNSSDENNSTVWFLSFRVSTVVMPVILLEVTSES